MTFRRRWHRLQDPRLVRLAPAQPAAHGHDRVAQLPLPPDEHTRRVRADGSSSGRRPSRTPLPRSPTTGSRSSGPTRATPPPHSDHSRISRDSAVRPPHRNPSLSHLPTCTRKRAQLLSTSLTRSTRSPRTDDPGSADQVPRASTTTFATSAPEYCCCPVISRPSRTANGLKRPAWM